MKSKMTRVITVETVKRTRVRIQAAETVTWCGICNTETRQFSPEDFARLNEMTASAVYRQIETGGLHYLETDMDELLICSGSHNNKLLPATGGEKTKQ